MNRIPADARCFACDYILQGLSAPVCPECGRAFDPNDLKTINTTGGSLGWKRLLIRPPGILLTLATLPALLVPLWIALTPGVFFYQVSLFFLSVLAIAIWVIRLIARSIVVYIVRCPSDLARPWHWRWFVTPLILLIAWVIPRDSITRLSFRYARPGMEDYARQIVQNPSAVWPPRRAGLLTITVQDASSTMVRFYCADDYHGATCGYAYSPTSTLTSKDFVTYFIDYYPLGGGWYQYYQHGAGTPFPAAATTAPTTAPATIPAVVKPAS